MKPSFYFMFSLLCHFARAQEPAAAEITGEARLLGKVADGTPPPLVPPRPMPDVTILKSTVRQEGARTITMNQVAPPELPEPPQPAPLPALSEPELEALLAQARENIRETRLVLISATVYDHERTLLRWWLPGDQERNLEPRNFEAWSNVDFHHLKGFQSFEYKDIEYMLIMGVGGMDTTLWRERMARAGRTLELPESPELPIDTPTYVVTKSEAEGPEDMKVMDGLHALYAKEKERLAAAYEARQKAREEREAHLKANPPKPKDTVVHFWRRPREEQSKQGGGSR